MNNNISQLQGVNMRPMSNLPSNNFISLSTENQ